MNAQQILSGLGWSTLSTAVSAVCQIAFMAVLGRLLDPAAFGLMAMAGIALRFASYFAQLGFGQALVQRPALEATDTTAALLMAGVFGVSLYGAMVLAAPLFATVFRAPELVALIGVLGASLLLGTLGSLPLALLRRAARFKRVNAIELLGFVVGYGGVGIACAARGWGVWSLVAATLSQQALVMGLGFLAVRYPLAWPVPRACYGRLWSYGSRYSVIGFLEFLYGNVETLFVGRALGKGALGLLNRATTLTSLPVELGVTAVNKVVFPALAVMQQDRARLADGFQMLLLCVGLFSGALACGVAAAAPDLVRLVLGSTWSSITPLVTIIALSVPPAFMYVACGVTMDSMAILGPKLRLQALVLALKVALVLAFARGGLPGVATAVVMAEAVRLCAGLGLLARLLDIRVRRFVASMALVAAMGAAVWAAVGATLAAGVAMDLPLVARVPLEALAGAAAASGYAPLQRFASVRAWHARLVKLVQARSACP
jgi:O-antigen/teichoic acid export membrane protein